LIKSGYEDIFNVTKNIYISNNVGYSKNPVKTYKKIKQHNNFLHLSLKKMFFWSTKLKNLG